MRNLAEFWKQKLRSSTSTFLISHLSLQIQRLFYTGSCMKHYMIFIKLVSNPKGRKLERKLAVCIFWYVSLGPPSLCYHANKPNSHDHPEPILSHSVYELFEFFFVKKQLNVGKPILFLVWQAAVFKLLIYVVLFFVQNVL